MKKRCFGESKIYADYHDNEWGVPVFDDRLLFEMLILEGAQAGLSWETVLNKRAHYQKVFKQFNPIACAKMTDDELEMLTQDAGIIRNRRKIWATRQNARCFIEIQQAFGTFSQYLWAFVDNKPIINHWQTFQDIPTQTPESQALSKDLKKRGMTFVGPTIMYAYMQAVGLVDDHVASCWKRN